MKESDSFVYLAAHDLRAPLMSVKGILNLIKLDPERKNLDQYCHLLENSVDKMNQSINDIITKSKSEKAKTLLQEVDLNTVATDAIESLYFMTGAEFVQIIVSIDDVKFISDYRLLLSIFSNLISNAIRYRDSDKISSYLKISASSNNEDVEIIFEDNGIGIEESIHDKIFDPFFLNNPEQGGTGLGLYMVKSSVEKLDGTIQLQSKPGVGTTFTVQIPKLIRKE
jgi:signal transduction histidine kinase